MSSVCICLFRCVYGRAFVVLAPKCSNKSSQGKLTRANSEHPTSWPSDCVSRLRVAQFALAYAVCTVSLHKGWSEITIYQCQRCTFSIVSLHIVTFSFSPPTSAVPWHKHVIWCQIVRILAATTAHLFLSTRKVKTRSYYT